MSKLESSCEHRDLCHYLRKHIEKETNNND